MADRTAVESVHIIKVLIMAKCGCAFAAYMVIKGFSGFDEKSLALNLHISLEM